MGTPCEWQARASSPGALRGPLTMRRPPTSASALRATACQKAAGFTSAGSTQPGASRPWFGFAGLRGRAVRRGLARSAGAAVPACLQRRQLRLEAWPAWPPSSSCSSRALAAMARTASNSSRVTRSRSAAMRSTRSRTRVSISSRRPLRVLNAPLATRARSSNRRLLVCMAHSSRARRSRQHTASDMGRSRIACNPGRRGCPLVPRRAYDLSSSAPWRRFAEVDSALPVLRHPVPGHRPGADLDRAVRDPLVRAGLHRRHRAAAGGWCAGWCSARAGRSRPRRSTTCSSMSRWASSWAAGSATSCSTSPATTSRHPLDMLAVWHGGMSFHGGLLGVLVGDLAVRAHAASSRSSS